MASKETLEELIDAYISWRAFQTRECIENDYRYKKLLKDLDRLELLEQENQELKNKNTAIELWNECYTKENSKLKNALELLKNKKVNLFHIWVFDDYTQYKEHYPFAEYSAEEDMLNAEEFDLLKEWLEE